MCQHLDLDLDWRESLSVKWGGLAVCYRLAQCEADYNNKNKEFI